MHNDYDHFEFLCIINPQCACAATVTVVVLCVCDNVAILQPSFISCLTYLVGVDNASV